MSVNLTPQKTAVSEAVVWKTDTFRIKELEVMEKTLITADECSCGKCLECDARAYHADRAVSIKAAARVWDAVRGTNADMCGSASKAYRLCVDAAKRELERIEQGH